MLLVESCLYHLQPYECFILYLFIYVCAGPSSLFGLFSSWSEWGLLSDRGVQASLVEHRLECAGSSCCGSQAPRHKLVVVAHGLSCSVACGIFPDQGWNLWLLHLPANSLPLSHQGSPVNAFLTSLGLHYVTCEMELYLAIL